MSFSDLADKFDIVTQHLKEGLQTITVLETFFKSYKRLVDAFGTALEKNGMSFQSDLPVESGVDTLSTAMAAIPLSLKKVSEQYSTYAQSLQLEVIEPLDLFFEHFTNTNATLMSTGSQAFSQVTRAKERLDKLKGRYIDACGLVEKADQSVLMADGDKLEKEKKRAAAVTHMAKLAAERYTQSVFDYNTALSEYERKSPDILESLQQSEESRVHFLKYTMEKFIRLQQKLDLTSGGLFGDMSAIVGNINSPIDIRVFVDGHKSINPQLQKEEFLPYEAWKREEDLKEEEGEKTISLEVEMSIVLKEVVITLVPKLTRTSIDSSSESEESDTSIDVEDSLDPSKLSKVIDHLRTPEGRYSFLELLDTRRVWNLLSLKNLTQLSDLFNLMLTEIQMSNDRDSAVFFKIITLAQVFCTEQEGRRRYLNSFIAQHRIWSDNVRWVQTIEWVVATRVAMERESVQRQKRRHRGSGLFGTIKTIATKLPNIFQKEQTDDKAEKSSAFMVLSQFNFHMINLGLSIDIASENILSCCFKMHLDSERTCVLLAELQANQRSSKLPSNSDTRGLRKSLKHREKQRLTWGSMLPLALASEFLPESDFISVVLTNKAWSGSLARFLLRLRVVRTSQNRLEVIRSSAWKYMLASYADMVDYHALLWKVRTFQVLAKDIEDVIAMDVQRSFLTHPHITSEILSNLLRTYAFYNPEIGYCQGMNYIAGNLYIQLQDEEASFKCLVGLVEKFNMHSLLVKQLPRLKLFFYQLDRLVGILLPEVHEIFKEEMISSSHFSSPWFLTLFASVYQGANKRRDVLLQLWDLFLFVRTKQDGWKVVFKVAIAILQTLQEEIVTRKFEDIMGLLTGLHSHSATTGIYEDSFISQVRSVKVTTSLLRDLESEYEHLKLRATIPRQQY